MRVLSQTQVEKAKEEMKSQMKTVISKCEINDLTYCQYQYELGVAFCKEMIIEFDYSERIIQMEAYWKWFKNEYRQFEALLIHYFNVTKLKENRDTFNWESYCRKMDRIKYCQRTYLSFKHFLSLQNKGL